MSAKNRILAAFVSLLTLTAFSAPVMESDARRAAESFVTNDSLGSAVLAGRSVDGIWQRGHLWIVALQPSGHLILSASDLAEPIVGFSENDFTEPDPESPAYAVLEAASDRIAHLEDDAATERDPQWDALLHPTTRRLLGASPVANPTTIIIPPLLSSHYNQCQPYNDFSPLYEPNTNNVFSYRGRCPCGCVATATAAEMHYYRWPARIDYSISNNHTVTTSSGTSEFPLRFDGHTPIDWDKINDNYIPYYYYTNWVDATSWSGWWTESELRGTVPETNRFPIARLILWADLLAKMSFGSGSSYANFDTVASSLSDWYTDGEWIYSSFESVTNCLKKGIPCQASIAKYVSGVRSSGHQVIFDGWAQGGSVKLVHINYGWGGDNDGYYDISKTFSDSSGEYTLEKFYANHFPRAKPQLAPLPTICPTSLTLNWHFPDFHTNKLSGFTVSAQKMGTTPTTFSDNFSNSTGISSSTAQIYVGTDSDYTLDGNLLYAKSLASGYWTYPNAYTLTSASVLTFKILSFAALGMICEVQAKTTNGEWQTICTPSLKTSWGSSGWSTERVYLGGMGGQSVNLRVAFMFKNGSSYYSAGRILIDDFQITSVLAPQDPQTIGVGKTARSVTLTDLTAGADYTFTVTPVISGALVDGETSDPLTVTIAGTHSTPTPGQQTYTTTNSPIFSTSDSSGVWSYSSHNQGYREITKDSISDICWAYVSANLPADHEITTSSIVSFRYKANNDYSQGHDIFSVKFTKNDGTITTLWTTNNTTAITSTWQNKSVSLRSLAGQRGTITISYEFTGTPKLSTHKGTISLAQVKNLRFLSVPAVAWAEETLTALGTPEIQSVSPVAEGFYKGCGVGTTTFTVQCSEHVTNLVAHSSHPSLLSDDDITYADNGNGKWTVAITPSGVTSANYRSRMILTLEATDSNGTKAYKDLSLRFDAVEEAIPDEGGDEGEPVTVTIPTSGNATTVTIPAEWFAEYWPTETDRAGLVASNNDSDGDGIPNWQEFICGTNPTNAEQKAVIECNMTFASGGSVVVTLPDDGRTPGSGYTKKIKGSDNLRDWVDVESGATTTKHFFKVVIEQE